MKVFLNKWDYIILQSRNDGDDTQWQADQERPNSIRGSTNPVSLILFTFTIVYSIPLPPKNVEKYLLKYLLILNKSQSIIV